MPMVGVCINKMIKFSRINKSSKVDKPYPDKTENSPNNRCAVCTVKLILGIN